MAITRTYTGQNPDGTPHFDIVADGPVILTGPVKGYITTADGTIYDVNEQFIEVAADHIDQVTDAIGMKHIEEGHPDFIADPLKDSWGFTFVDSQGVEHVSPNATADPVPVDPAVGG
jgi:hypothetical protein